MQSTLRKTQKLRGHVSHGQGCISKRQKYPAGWSNAGGMHHHRINFNRITLGKLQIQVNAAKTKTEAAPIIDAVQSTTKFWGRVSSQSSLSQSRRAEEKIGGWWGGCVCCVLAA
uniref:Large ribosomal subunit protein uL15 n=1 Tax=Equus caballus TaxID=9796 RepID=A0A9L0S515_HORSE